MADLVYNVGHAKLCSTSSNWLTSTIKALLVKSTYTADKDHASVADVVSGSQEISVAGYARQTLANPSIEQDDVNDLVKYLGDAISFGALPTGQTVGGMVLFIDGASDAERYPLFFYDLEDTPTNGSGLGVTPNAGGYFQTKQTT